MGVLIFLFLIIIFIFLQRKLYSRFIFKSLEIKRSFNVTGMSQGDAADFEMTLVNKKLLPVTWLQTEQWIPAALKIENAGSPVLSSSAKYEFNCIFSIAPYQKITRKYKITGLKRGYFEFSEGIRLSSTDLFGSMQLETEINPPLHLAVYPRLLDARNCLLPARSLQGDLIVDRWIIDDPLMAAGTRDYTGSESIRNISWKATARHEKVQVRVFEHTADRKILLLLYLPFTVWTNTALEAELLESAVEAAASVAVMLTDKGIQVGFATNASCISNPDNLIIPPGCSDVHVETLLTAFAAVTSYCQTDFQGVFEKADESLSGDTEMIIVAPCVDDTMQEALGAVAGRKVSLILLRPSDRDIPKNMDLFYFSEGDGAD